MLQKIDYKKIKRYFKQMLYAVVGIPDYQQYFEYAKRCQPQGIMDYETFYKNRVEARYNGGSHSKCC